MADLSAYISNTITLDKTSVISPVITITDTGVYPAGVAATVTGIVNILQPDGVTRSGNWATPDIVYSAGALQPSNIPLRLDVNNKLQQGTYTVTYIINATGYTPTTLVHSFNIAFLEPTGALTEQFNLITPSLSYQDGTNYTVGSFTNSLIRAWSSVMCQGTINGTNPVLDLKWTDNNYYDSNYVTTLTSTVTYTSTSYAYLFIKIKLVTTVNKDIYTLPTQASLLVSLTNLKAKVDTANPSVYDDLQETYLNAFILWRHANARICSSDFNGVEKYYYQMQVIFAGNIAPTLVHTNAAIAPYVYTCETGTGVYTPYYISVKAGTPQAISAGVVVGATTIVNSNFVGHNVNLWSDDMIVDDQNFGDGALYFTKVLGSNTITLSSPIVAGQKIKIQTL